MPENTIENNISIKDKLNQLEKEYDAKKDFYIKAAKTLKNLIINLLDDKFNKTNVLYRIKERNSCSEKISRKYIERLEQESNIKIEELLTDLIGIRIICMYESEIKDIAELLEQEFDLLEKTDKTQELLKNDNAFGYKGLHLDIKLQDKRTELTEYNTYKDLQFEIQIRTIIQNAWSELDHQIKYKKHIPKELGRRINRLAALFEIADTEFESIDSVSQKLESEAKKASVLTIQDEKTPKKKQKQKEDEKEKVKLDIFSFVALLGEFFEDVYQSWAVESLLDDILECNPDYEFTTAFKAVKENLKIVEQYVSEKGVEPSFLTQVRYAIYLSDKHKFENLLYPILRKEFDGWLKVQKEKKSV